MFSDNIIIFTIIKIIHFEKVMIYEWFCISKNQELIDLFNFLLLMNFSYMKLIYIL